MTLYSRNYHNLVTKRIYIRPRDSNSSMALKLIDPPGRSPYRFYHELLGIAVAAWLTSGDQTLARSYCTSKIRRFRQVSNSIGAATSHLQYGPMLQGIWAHSPYLSNSLEWAKAYPEQKKSEHTWKPEDIGIYMTDLVARDSVTLVSKLPTLTPITEDADLIHNALILEEISI